MTDAIIGIKEAIWIVVPFISGAFGVGMTYQLVKSRLEDQEKRLAKVEGKLEMQVGSPSCDKLREECGDQKTAMYASIKADVETVREQMQAEFKDYREFKGFVHAKIETVSDRERNRDKDLLLDKRGSKHVL
jgi:hypothetical protein